jgi:hypothetical protein
MEEYKPTYGTSLLYVGATMILCSPLVFVSLDILAALEDPQLFHGQIFLYGMAAMLACEVAFGFLVLILNLIIGLFSKKIVVLTEYAISYEEKTIPLNSIHYITLYLPEMSKTSSKPQLLVVWADDKNYIEIKHPSLSLIAALKRRCVCASFDVDNWQSHLKQCLWIQVFVPVVFILAMIFGFE